MIKYLIYEVNESHSNMSRDLKPVNKFILIESRLNETLGYDSMEEALAVIKSRGDNYTNYTILPHIYMVD